MGSVYYKTLIMILTILLGFFLHRIHVFSKEDALTISKIMMNVTLPAVVVKNLNGMILNMDIFVAAMAGFAINAFFCAMAFVFSSKSDVEDRAVKIFSFCSFNIGSYTIPVLNSFVTPAAMAGILAFNYPGTAIFTYCVAPAVGCALYGKKGEPLVISVQKKLLRNVPAMTCFGMLFLCFAHISFPSGMLGFFTMLSEANTTLAMLSIGILLNFRFSKPELVADLKTVLLRLSFAAISATAILLILPASEELCKALALTVFAPIASSMPIIALHSGYKGGRVAVVNSLYLIVSVCVMSLMILFLY